ncbi:hypothetical protein [Methyloversatilis thermotolerans]|nr:hypothetical protein [Methyloversatilis thermotolerans]
MSIIDRSAGADVMEIQVCGGCHTAGIQADRPAADNGLVASFICIRHP